MGLCFARKNTGTRRGEGVVCGVWEIACLISFKRREAIGWWNGKWCDGCVYKTFWEEIFLLLVYHIIPSPGSRDLLCKRLHQFTAKVIANPLFHLLSGQEPSGLDNGSADPLWLNAVEPGTLGRQPARDDAYTTFASVSLLQHRLIVLTQPGSDLLTHPVWDALSPHQHEHLLALRLDPAHQATAENLWFYVVQGQEQS